MGNPTLKALNARALRIYKDILQKDNDEFEMGEEEEVDNEFLGGDEENPLNDFFNSNRDDDDDEEEEDIFLDDQVEVAGRAYPTMLLAAEK